MPVETNVVDSRSAPPAPNQFRIRDLMLVTLAYCVILGWGRARGGGIGPDEGIAFGTAITSIAIAATFLRRRWIWTLFLVAAFAGIVLFAPSDQSVSLAALLVVHCFFAALPVLIVGPQQSRWRWIAAAGGVQLTAAMFSRPDEGFEGFSVLFAIPAGVFEMFLFAAVFSWLLAIGAVGWRFAQIGKRPPRDVDTRRG